MTQQFCCPKCFANPWLVQHVKENRNKVGRCGYCGASKVPLIEVSELAGHIQNLVDRYEPSSGDLNEISDEIISWVQSWEVFNEDRLDEETMCRLFEDILNTGWDDDSGEMPIRAHDLYVKQGGPWHSSHADLWGEFCYDVLQNPEAPLPFHEFFEENFDLASATLLQGTIVYRARLGFIEDQSGKRTPYTGSDIGSPPPDKASAGRANRKGRTVLYCAYEEKTAIAEMRPAKGLLVSVCSLEVIKEIRIIDLTKELDWPNPFLDESLAYSVELLELLHQLGEDMGHPLEKNDDTSLYIPCQRLAEYLEQAGYAGICYPSSLNDGGRNLVLFDPSVAKILSSKLVKIIGVSIEYKDENRPSQLRHPA